jgi:hypothetical protein
MPAGSATAPVDVVKLRMKIGVHELEAEGPRDLVMAQLEIWRQLAGLGANQAHPIAGDDAALRRLFAIDAPHIAAAAFAGLARQGLIPAADAEAVAKELEISLSDPDPMDL